METISTYRKFIEDHKSKIWNIITTEILPKVKDILESYDDVLESSSVVLVDSDLNACRLNDIDCFIFIRFQLPNDEEFDRIHDEIISRIRSELNDDIYLYSDEININDECELLYEIR